MGVEFEVTSEYQDFMMKIEERESSDRVVGSIMPVDNNGGYFSIVAYKAFWLGHNYGFYFKIGSKSGQFNYLFKKSHVSILQ